MLEISARQTGKSARLLQTVYSRLHDPLYPSDTRFVIVGRDHDHASHLCERFLKRYSNLHMEQLMFIPYNRVTPETVLFPERILYDDFDNYIDSININQSSYYTATPTKLRTLEEFLTDPLCALIRAHRGIVQSYMWNDFSEALKWQKQSNTEHFKMECFGQYLK